jgi:hypothetical protein
MQVELLRDLFNDAINEPNEDTRVGCFWCFASDYEECLPFLKEILMNEKIESIVTEDCKIERIENSFTLKDFHGGIDIYSYEDAAFLVDLWDKAQNVKPNKIYFVMDKYK